MFGYPPFTRPDYREQWYKLASVLLLLTSAIPVLKPCTQFRFPKGASGIVGWQRHMLFRDIAAGELNPDEIAEKYAIPTQSVYDLRRRKKAELKVILDDWSNEFSDLWSVKSMPGWPILSIWPMSCRPVWMS
jgi:hypothetical protein